MSEWQPIETLPRDGRYVIAYRPLAMETGDQTISIVRTMETATRSPQGIKHYTDRWCHPTHWMDIPELPNPKSAPLETAPQNTAERVPSSDAAPGGADT